MMTVFIHSGSAGFNTCIILIAYHPTWAHLARDHDKIARHEEAERPTEMRLSDWTSNVKGGEGALEASAVPER